MVPRDQCAWRPRLLLPCPLALRQQQFGAAFLRQGVLVHACDDGDHAQPAALGNEKGGAGREGADTFLENTRSGENSASRCPGGGGRGRSGWAWPLLPIVRRARNVWNGVWPTGAGQVAPACCNVLLCCQGSRGTGWCRRVPPLARSRWEDSPWGGDGRGCTWRKPRAPGEFLRAPGLVVSFARRNNHTGIRKANSCNLTARCAQNLQNGGTLYRTSESGPKVPHCNSPKNGPGMRPRSRSIFVESLSPSTQRFLTLARAFCLLALLGALYAVFSPPILPFSHVSSLWRRVLHASRTTG